MNTTNASPLGLLRADLLALEPYRHAPWEPGLTRLHANESPWRGPADDSRAGLNRYPVPYPRALEERLAALYGVRAEQLIAARGSDECIDLVTRVALVAGRDAILCCPPTFPMYALCARVHGARVQGVPLAGPGYDPDLIGIDAALDLTVKLVYLCSPNNPTGGAVPLGTIDALAARLAGRSLLVVDEAYAEFSRVASAATLLADHPNLVVLRTLSKAYALAGARVGAALGHPDLIDVLRRIVPPYALPTPSIEAAEAALTADSLAVAGERIATLIAERERVTRQLARLDSVVEVLPSDANFVLVRCAEPAALLAAGRAAGLLLRDFSRTPGIEGCVRISIGTAEQNDAVLAAVGSLAS